MSNQLLLRRRAMCQSSKSIDYFKLTALEDGITLSLDKVGNPPDHPMEYSFNKGAFTPYTFGTTINFDEGDTIRWRRTKGYSSNALSDSNNGNNNYTFVPSGGFSISGDICTLLDFEGNIQSIGSSGFKKLLNSTEFSGNLVIKEQITSLGYGAFQYCKCTNVYCNANISGYSNSCFYNMGNINIFAIKHHPFSTQIGSFQSVNIATIDFDGTFYDWIKNEITFGYEGSPRRSTTQGFVRNGVPIEVPKDAVVPSNFDIVGNIAYFSEIETVTISGSTTVVKNIGWCPNLTEIYLGEGVTNIEGFSNNPKLKHIVLPSTVVSLGSQVFANNRFDYMVCKATTPPTVGNQWFVYGDVNKIYVPYSVDHSILNAYKTATNWSGYSNKIFELDENGEIPS